MKILLIGGTGAMGTHLAKLASAAGWEVFVTSRRQRVNEPNIQFLCGNAHDDHFLSSLLKGSYDIIVDFMIYQTDAFANRVERMLAACSQYFYLSSARVYADSESPLTEESPRLLDVCDDKDYLMTKEYALLKARQEDLLFESQRSNWTIIRPYITFSETRLQLGVLEKEDWLFRALKGRTVVFSREISERTTTLTYGRDVAEAILLLCGVEKSKSQVFHATSDTTIRWSDVLDVYLKAVSNYTQSKPAVELLSLEDFLKTHSAHYQVIYDRLYDRVFDNSKISTIAGWKSSKCVPEVLSDCLEVFLKAPLFDEINWAKEGIRDQYVSEREHLTEVKGVKNKLRYVRSRYLTSKK